MGPAPIFRTAFCAVILVMTSPVRLDTADLVRSAERAASRGGIKLCTLHSESRRPVCWNVYYGLRDMLEPCPANPVTSTGPVLLTRLINPIVTSS
jgi:hypothetical protein